MYLKIETPQFGKELSEEIATFISEAEGLNVIVENNNILDKDQNEGWTQADLFKMGMEFGQKKERERWIEPESIYLPNQYAEHLERVITDYENDTHVEINSIILKKTEYSTEVIVKPTVLKHLFNIFTEYGERTKDI